MAIISFSKNFVFIKTRKTAGTSLEVLLEKCCDDHDIVTEIFPPNPDHSPRNFLLPQGGGKCYNHMSGVEIRSFFPDFYEESFKFCFERHPIDKCISFYAMLKNSPHHQGIDSCSTWGEFVERGEFPVDDGLYTDTEGNLIVNKIYKYEDLDFALRDIEIQTGITLPFLNIWEKSGFRFNVPSLSDVTNSKAQRERILSAFSATLKYVSYD